MSWISSVHFPLSTMVFQDHYSVPTELYLQPSISFLAQSSQVFHIPQKAPWSDSSRQQPSLWYELLYQSRFFRCNKTSWPQPLREKVWLKDPEGWVLMLQRCESKWQAWHQKFGRSHLQLKTRSRESKMKVGSIYELWNLSANDLLHPAKLSLLNLPRQCHQLEGKCSNAEAIENLPH